MKISELKSGTGNVDIQGELVTKEEGRDVITKFGKISKV